MAELFFNDVGTLRPVTELTAPGAVWDNGRLTLPDPSIPTFYASKGGVVGGADLLTPGSGANDTTAVQALLNMSSGGTPIHVVLDRRCRVDYLNIYGNTWLDIWPGCGFIQNNGAPRALLRNAHPSGSSRTDKNIRITGGFWNGNSPNQSGTGLFNTQESNGTLLGLIQMFGVENLLIENVYLYHSKTIATFCANIFNGHYNNLFIDNNLGGQVQQGGLQIDSPSSVITISNLRGSTEDDLLALNTDDASWVNGSFTGLGPYIVGGDIRDVAAVNIVGFAGCGYGVRFFNSTHRIDNIRISNIAGEFANRVFHNEQLTIGPGNVGTFEIDGMNVRPAAAVTSAAFLDVYGRMERLILKNIQVGNLIDTRPLLRINNSADIDYLEVDGMGINETDNQAAGLIPVPVTGRVQRLTARNWNWRRHYVLPTGTDFVKMMSANSQVEDFCAEDITANRVANFLNAPTGRVGRFSADGILLADSLGGAAVRSSIGMNEVMVNRFAGDYAVPLVTSVAPVSKRGDAFARDTTAPTVSSTAASGAAPYVVVIFSEPINSSNLANGVTIKKNGVTQTIISAKRRDYDSTEVEFVLSANVAVGDTVTWEYAAASGDYQDLSGNLLANVSPTTVTPSRTGYVYDLYEGAYDTAANGRAPSPLSPGANWTTFMGTAAKQKLRGGRLTLDGSAPSTEALVVDAGHGDIICYSTLWIEHLPTGNSAVGLIFRATDASNYWVYLLNYNSATLYKVAAGVVSSWTTPYTTFTRVAHLPTVVCNGTSITCSTFGTAVISRTDSFNQTAGKVGVRGDESLVWADDFTCVSFS